MVKGQVATGDSHARSSSFCQRDWNNGTQPDQFHRIVWSPDWKNYTAHHLGRKTIPPWSLDAMATLQQKGPIISRSSFAALDVEEPESEEEPAVVELPPTESEHLLL